MPGTAVTAWSPPATQPMPMPKPPGSTGMRTTILCAVIMIGVVFGANIVNAAVPMPGDPGPISMGPAVPAEPGASANPNQPPVSPVNPGPVTPGEGLAIGSGVVIYPTGGWTAVPADAGIMAFQKASVTLVFIPLAWDGAPEELLVKYRDLFFEGGKFQSNDPTTGTIGGGVIPAATIGYAGNINGTQVDGAIIVGAKNGTGLVINVLGPQGSLTNVTDDLNKVLGTVEFTGGQG
jgi:hypothetical protein